MSFGLGLLPIDQVTRRSTDGLRLDEADQGTGANLGSRELQVPTNGIQYQQIKFDRCDDWGKRVLSFSVPPAATRPASVVVADPEFVAAGK